MKDYSLNESDAKIFFLNYSIEGDKIIIHFVSGGDSSIAYTEKNEKRILEMMKEQVLNSSDFRIEQKIMQKKLYFDIIAHFLALLINSLIILFTFLGSSPISLIVSLGVFGVILVDCRKSYNNFKNSEELIEDLNKNKLFLDNEKLLNETILSCVGEKLKESCVSISEDKQLLTLNDMDRFEYEELKTILEIIRIQRKRQEKCEASVLAAPEQSPVLTRKKNN